MTLRRDRNAEEMLSLNRCLVQVADTFIKIAHEYEMLERSHQSSSFIAVDPMDGKIITVLTYA